MKYYNANPAGKRTVDCVYRALSFFLGVTWMKAVFELVIHATNRGLVNFNYFTNLTSYLAEKGYQRQKPPRKGMTIEDFIKEIAQKGKYYLIAVPGHLTVVDNESEIVDTWDCSKKTIKYYWER